VTCTADQLQTDETTGTVFNGSCTNGAGLSTNAAPLTVKLDKTGPSANLAVTAGTLGANGWYTSNVTVSTTGSDSISSPVTCTADQVQTTDTGGATFNGSCTNDAGLTTNAAPLTVKLDKSAPTITISLPAAGASYVLGATVASNYSCADQPGLSGVSTCAGTVASGSNIDTSTVGPHTFTVNATDQAGNASSQTHTYYVNYSFSGFLEPVSLDRAFKLGSTIPIKWRLATASGGYITSLSAVTSLKVALDSNCDGTPDGTPFTPDAAGGTALRYDTTENQYIFNWKTTGLSAKCYEILLTLNDSSPVKMKKVELRATGNNSLVAASGDGGGSSSAGVLLAGEITLFVNDPAGSLDAGQVARIEQAVATINAGLAPYGASIRQLDSITDDAPTIRFEIANTSVCGTAAQGVLGCSSETGEITLLQGWNWYADADASSVGSDQYDYQTVVIHELGHSVGMGHSVSTSSFMYGSLDTGTARRSVSASELAALATGGGGALRREALLAGGMGDHEAHDHDQTAEGGGDAEQVDAYLVISQGSDQSLDLMASDSSSDALASLEVLSLEMDGSVRNVDRSASGDFDNSPTAYEAYLYSVGSPSSNDSDDDMGAIATDVVIADLLA
jgi:hypothetical protein